MDIRKAVEDIFPMLVEQRRYLHENPELSEVEFNTLKYITEKLKDFGITEITEVPDGGIIAYIRGGQAAEGGKKLIMLRADIDALPIDEPDMNLSQKRSCISKVPGVMHACGHDSHTSMLLGAGKILNEHKAELKGDVLLCFERGEETSIPIGNMVQYFKDNGIKYDICFGMHVNATYNTGDVGIGGGNAHAGSIPIKYRITGKGGHGSRTDLVNNPVDIMADMINQFNLIKTRDISPYDNFSHSVCYIKAGNAANVIPETVEFYGTARYYTEASKNIWLKRTHEIAEGLSIVYGCQIEDLAGDSHSYYSVVNDYAAADIAKAAAAKLLGEEHIQPQVVSMGSESFGRYYEVGPGVFINLGITNPEKGTGSWVHTPKFDIDEDAMKTGCGMHVAMVYQYLNGGF